MKFWQRVASAQQYGKRSWLSAVFSSTWSSLGSFIGTYDAVDPRNKAMRGVLARPATAADLITSLPYIRNLCRNYERNNTTVRSGTEAVVAITVGTGIALEPQTGNPEYDEKLRPHWINYIHDCGINGESLYELEATGMRDVVVAGELLWRLVIDHQRIGQGKIPLLVMPIEPEWLGDFNFGTPTNNGGTMGGIDLDDYCRAVAYNLRNPNGKLEKVPAASVIHWFERRRALQIRGEPWWAPVLTTLRQVKDLVTAELEAAKNTAGFAASIETTMSPSFQQDERGSPVRDIEIGSITELAPGEKMTMYSHTRPSQQIAPFRDMLNGDIAAAMRIGKRWLTRNVSDANYSSMKADQLDQERLSAPLRENFGRGTAGKLWKAVLPYLCIKAGVPYGDYGYRLIADGQPYLDPLKDVQAAAFAIAFGLSDFETEVGKRGGDYKDTWDRLKKQVDELQSRGLVIKDPTGVVVGTDPADAGGASGDGLKEHADHRPRDQSGNYI